MSDVSIDFLGQGLNSETAFALASTNGNTNVLRPFIGNDGRSYISVPTGEVDAAGKPVYRAQVTNSGATLRKNEWEWLDSMVVPVAKKRLQFVNRLRANGQVISFPNAYNHSVYTYQRNTDIGPATIGMNPRSRAENDRVTFDQVSLPLPIISKEIEMDAREIAIRRNGGVPLDTTMVEQAADRVAEYIEQLALGTLSTYTFNGFPLHGILNFPQRITGSFLNPSVSGWTPSMLFNSVISMVDAATNVNRFGPYDLYYSRGLMPFMLRDYTQNYDGGNLVNKISMIPSIQSVTMLDYLTGNQLVLVERSPSTAKVLVGMDITTVQWQENGGLSQKLRVMGMILPVMYRDANNSTGIVHYSGAATTV
ncbi:MAG: major capsid protein [bacterium]|jgi:uncharacterized linocin/CFP29 family protein